MSDAETKFVRSIGMASPFPEVPPERSAHLTSFGFPMPLKKLHRAITAALNKVPLKDHENEPLREALMAQIRRGITDDELFRAITLRVGTATAREDIIEKRISQMTLVDYLADSEYATPDAAAVEKAKKKVIDPENQRFAKVQPVEGKRANEWDMLDLEGP